MDKKNIFGLTPLMKAAIQGHVRCAKTLLFAGTAHISILSHEMPTIPRIVRKTATSRLTYSHCIFSFRSLFRSLSPLFCCFCCFKRIMQTGASPSETDYKRQLRADQWATFCGRHSCAEQIEKFSEGKIRGDEPSMLFTKTRDKNIPGRPRANSVAQTSPKLTFGSIKNQGDGGTFDFNTFTAMHGKVLPKLR